jgi:hypothetical protein
LGVPLILDVPLTEPDNFEAIITSELMLDVVDIDPAR